MLCPAALALCGAQRSCCASVLTQAEASFKVLLVCVQVVVGWGGRRFLRGGCCVHMEAVCDGVVVALRGVGGVLVPHTHCPRYPVVIVLPSLSSPVSRGA